MEEAVKEWNKEREKSLEILSNINKLNLLKDFNDWIALEREEMRVRSGENFIDECDFFQIRGYTDCLDKLEKFVREKIKLLKNE